MEAYIGKVLIRSFHQESLSCLGKRKTGLPRMVRRRPILPFLYYSGCIFGYCNNESMTYICLNIFEQRSLVLIPIPGSAVLLASVLLLILPGKIQKESQLRASYLEDGDLKVRTTTTKIMAPSA